MKGTAAEALKGWDKNGTPKPKYPIVELTNELKKLLGGGPPVTPYLVFVFPTPNGNFKVVSQAVIPPMAVQDTLALYAFTLFQLLFPPPPSVGEAAPPKKGPSMESLPPQASSARAQTRTSPAASDDDPVPQMSEPQQSPEERWRW